MDWAMFFEGCIVSWKSKLHGSVTLSTNNCYSEYVSASKLAREVKWASELFTSMGVERLLGSPIAIFCDSAGAVALCYNPVNHESNKHVDAAAHYARELVERGLIAITFVPTREMVADLLTKALPVKQFEYLLLQFMADHYYAG